MKSTALIAAVAAVLTVTSIASAAPSSGMLLGVYAFSNSQGLRVTGTIPGYAADGVLFPGDVLKRVTPDGVEIYSARTHWSLENAKDMIGPYRQSSLEVYRPGVGMIYFWVEFRPIDGGPAAYAVNGKPVKQKMTVRIMTENQKPGARNLFNRGQGRPNNGNTRPGNQNNGGSPNNGGFPIPRPRPNGNNGGAGSLFGR